MAGKGLGYTAADAAYQYMCWVAIVFAFLKLINTDYTRNEIWICIFLNVLGILIWLFSGSTTALLTTVAITSMKNINYTIVLKIGFWIRGPMFFIRTAMALMGIIDIQKQYFFESSGNIRVRYGLGYGQPNAAHFCLFVAIVLCVLVYNYRMKLWHYVALLFYNYFIFYYTNSRTGFLMTTIFLILCWLISTNGILSRILWKGIRAMSDKAFIITTVVSFTASVLFWKIDFLRSFGTFSSRFRTAIDVINNNNLNLFGTRGISTDLGMINFLYGDGCIFLLLFLAGYYFLLKRYSTRDNVLFMIACCCYAVYCLSEAYADSVLMNMTLLAFGYLLYPPDPIQERKDSGFINCRD